MDNMTSRKKLAGLAALVAALIGAAVWVALNFTTVKAKIVAVWSKIRGTIAPPTTGTQTVGNLVIITTPQTDGSIVVSGSITPGPSPGDIVQALLGDGTAYVATLYDGIPSASGDALTPFTIPAAQATDNWQVGIFLQYNVATAISMFPTANLTPILK